MILPNSEKCCCDGITKNSIKFDCNNIVAVGDNITLPVSGVDVQYDNISKSKVSFKKNDFVEYNGFGVIAKSDSNKSFEISDMSIRSMALLMALNGTVVTLGDNVDVEWYVNISSTNALPIPNTIGDFNERFEFVNSLLNDTEADLTFVEYISVNGVNLKMNMLIHDGVLSIDSVNIVNSDDVETQIAENGSDIFVSSPKFNTYKSYKSFMFMVLEDKFSFRIRNSANDDLVMDLVICQ